METQQQNEAMLKAAGEGKQLPGYQWAQDAPNCPARPNPELEHSQTVETKILRQRALYYQSDPSRPGSKHGATKAGYISMLQSERDGALKVIQLGNGLNNDITRLPAFYAYAAACRLLKENGH